MDIKRLEKLADKLRINEYQAIVCETGDDAVSFIKKHCKGKIVGMGDSHSVIEIGLIEALQSDGVELYACQLDKSRENKLRTISSDIFVLSANAISEETGEIVNIDSSCNRVAGSLYGPEVIFVIGANKVKANLSDAIDRAKNIAAPRNNAVHEYATPCVKSNRCEDCATYDRICRATVIYHKKPKTQKATVVLINEDLGF